LDNTNPERIKAFLSECEYFFPKLRAHYLEVIAKEFERTDSLVSREAVERSGACLAVMADLRRQFLKTYQNKELNQKIASAKHEQG